MSGNFMARSAIVEAKKYTEGRGLSIIVTDKKYLADIKTLIGIKVSH